MSFMTCTRSPVRVRRKMLLAIVPVTTDTHQDAACLAMQPGYDRALPDGVGLEEKEKIQNPIL